jgi:hypothetical protein
MLQKEEGAEHMAMTTCKECGKQVSTEAKACPHCGAAAPARKKAKGGIGKWLLVVFAIGVVVAVLPKQDKAKASASAPQRTQAAPVPDTPKKVEVTATEEKKADEVTDKQRAALAALKAQSEALDQRIAAAGAEQRKSWDAQTVEDAKLLRGCLEHRGCDVGTYPRVLRGKSRFFVFDTLGDPVSEQNIGGREIYYFAVPVADGRKSAKLQLSFEMSIVDSVNVY